MEDQVQYGMTDLRQYIEGRPFLPPPELLSFTQPYDMLMFGSDSTSSESAGRWPRQETLTLLDIRSRLDPKFKDANHKGPLWDEVSRIMSEENGYQRSGKKCREKFENLYKYYKKTKASRQDGKHYRFFTQLEALYGHTTTLSASATHFHGRDFPNSLPSDQETCPGSKISDTSLVSAPDSGDYDTTSTYCNNDDSREKKKRRGRRRSLKAKIEESIDAQMKNMMEKQEAWMEKMARAIESKERERAMREEQWRKQDAARIEREQEMWARERAWIEARDIAFLDAFNKLSGKELEPPLFTAGDVLPESDQMSRLRSGMDLIRVQENRIPPWDKMGCSGSMCREKWDQIINEYVMKKRKDNPKSSCTYSSPFLDHEVEENGYGNEGYFMGDSYQRLS